MVRRWLVLYVALLACTAGACNGANPTAPTAPMPEVRRVVVLGDSLAVTPSLAQSFPAHLQARIERAGLPWTVVNAGVSGDTTTDAMRRYEPLLGPDVGVLVLALGANDGLDGVPAATIERNLSAIIEAAQTRNIRVLLCGMETPPFNGWNYTVAFHAVFPRVARTYNVAIVPFLLSGVALIPDMNGADGIHPNAAGARRIAENVWISLEPMLRAGAATSTARLELPFVWRRTEAVQKADARG